MAQPVSRMKTSGTLDQPSIDAHLEVANLAVNDEFTGGGLVLDAVSHGDKLQLTGRSTFPQASVALDGTVDEKGNLQSDLQLQFTQVDIDPLLLAELKTRITGHSSLNGHASVSGPLREPRRLKGSMVIDAFTVEMEKIPIHSDGPIELELDDRGGLGETTDANGRRDAPSASAARWTSKANARWISMPRAISTWRFSMRWMTRSPPMARPTPT